MKIGMLLCTFYQSKIIQTADLLGIYQALLDPVFQKNNYYSLSDKLGLIQYTI